MDNDAVPANSSAQATNFPLKEGSAGPLKPSQRLLAPKLYLAESGEELLVVSAQERVDQSGVVTR